MVEEVKKTDSNTKTQLSLAAALFFSPLVQYILKRNTRDLSQEERNFVQWYIKFGYLTLLFGVVVIWSGVMNYLVALKILDVTYTVSIFVLLFLLLVSVVSILGDISLLKSGNTPLPMYNVNGSRKDILLKYLPFYNSYLWYQAHSFDIPNRRIKESLLLRTAFLTMNILGSVRWSIIVLIIIIVRIASLMSDIDILPVQRKHYLNTLFSKNPEELWWYITGTLIFLFKSIVHLFAPMLPYTLSQEITKEKFHYSQIITLSGNIPLIIEYILWMLLVGWLLFVVSPDITNRVYYSALILWIGRYVVMSIQLRHLPHLPIARELVLVGIRIKHILSYPFTPHR